MKAKAHTDAKILYIVLRRNRRDLKFIPKEERDGTPKVKKLIHPKELLFRTTGRYSERVPIT